MSLITGASTAGAPAQAPGRAGVPAGRDREGAAGIGRDREGPGETGRDREGPAGTAEGNRRVALGRWSGRIQGFAADLSLPGTLGHAACSVKTCESDPPWVRAPAGQ